MPAIAEHPTPEELTAFALGKLNSPQVQLIEDHLSECASCQDRVEAVAPDGLVELIVAAHSRIESERSSAPTPSIATTKGWSGSLSGPDLDTEPPAVLAIHPKYRVIRKLGSGGMGNVWLAEHTVMHRPVAIKLIRPELLARRGASDRFLREVRAAAKLHHPNIVTAFDAESIDDTCLLVMEYAPGETLAERVKWGQLPPRDACRAIRDAARGLAHAHAAGLVHRDVKPHNLIQSADGTVKVLDFGLAGIRAGETVAAAGNGLTGAGMVFGTPEYIAPEQITDPHTADARADIYSLGCTFYHLLSGHPPVPEGTMMSKLDAHRSREPDPLPGLACELAAILNKMLAKNPEDRYQTADEVVAALEPLCDEYGRPSPPERVGPYASFWRGYAKSTAIALPILAGIFVVAAVLGLSYLGQRETGTGELVIVTDEEDLKLVLSKNKEIVQIIDVSMNKEIPLRSGGYQLMVKNDPFGHFRLSSNRVDIRRGEQFIVIVERVGGDRPPQQKKGDEGKVSLPPGEISRDDIPVDARKEESCNVQVAFSPDGRYYLGAGSSPGSMMKIYDARTGQNLSWVTPDYQDFAGNGAKISWNGGQFNRDGSQLLTWSYGSKSLYVWDSLNHNANLLHKLEGHTEPISNGSFSPDGKEIVSGSQDHMLIIWDAVKGKKKRVLEGHTEDCGGCFSPDGKWIISAAGGEDSSIRVWDAATGKLKWKQPGYGLSDFRLSRSNLFSPDGTLLLSLSGKQIAIWEIASGKPVMTFKSNSDVVGASFHPDGTQVVSWGKDRFLHYWLIANGQNFRSLDLGWDLEADESPIVVISPNGRLILSAHDSNLRITELASGKEVVGYTFDNMKVSSMAFSRDSHAAVVGVSPRVTRNQAQAKGYVHLFKIPEAATASSKP